MSDPSRREFIQAGAAVSLLTSTAAPRRLEAAEESKVTTTAFGYQHSAVPLAFDVKSLKGISERLIQSHWENNYSGAIKALNTVRGRLTQALNDTNTLERRRTNWRSRLSLWR